MQRIAGYGGSSDVALTVARMLAAAQLGDRGIPDFLDRKAELTAADWIVMVESLGARSDAWELGSPNPFLEPPETEYLPPGALEQRCCDAVCLKIARLFGGSPELWVRLQATYDLKKSEQNKKIMARVARIVPITSVESRI